MASSKTKNEKRVKNVHRLKAWLKKKKKNGDRRFNV